ncbi:MAG: iron-containing alcohol dehydrogenase [Anaeroplasmataceae bacterium]
MNIFFKAYCRIFQFCFKVALPFLPYKDPIIIDNISGIIPVLLKNDKKRPMIVTDKTISSLGLLNGLIDSLKENNIDYVIYDDVVANPTTKNCDEALELFNKNSCDSLIAFGGGSPMDCAKGVGALKARPKKNLNKLKGILHVRKKIPLLIAIPTTAGTGSETTLACVIVDSNTRHKYAINDFPLIPSYACLDESVCMSLPGSVVATTGMDALTHAIEAYIGKSGNKKTRKDALEAIKLIFDNILISYNEKTRESRKNMLIASHKAGRAFSKAYVGYVHAIAHSLGGKYNVPHGLANAVILPVVLREYGKSIYKKMKKIAIYLGYATNKTSKEEACEMIISKIEEYNRLLNIPTTISGIKAEDIPEMSLYAYKEANPLYPVPKLWSKKKLQSIYRKIGE